jgi:MFS family permease
MPDTPEESPRGGAYPRYVLLVLVLVYVFNFLDRQIVSILAERIKADLGVSDAQLGFLYGTVFAVFFAIFGIPLGRLADAWDRRRLIAWGAAFWSLMTALSGFAKSFPHLALARMGVGVGEASAAPAAYSLLSDWFPKEKRATVLGLYSSGIYIGAGLGLGIGGLVVDRWDTAFPSGTGPFGLRGWQAAFLAVGLPGLVLAAWVRSLREPARAASHPPLTTTPVRTFLRESASVIPPFTLFALAAAGAGATGVLVNVAAFAALGGLAWLLAAALGNPAQWIALAVGLYAVFSWAQALRLTSRQDFDLVFKNRALVLANLGFGLVAFGTYGTSFWIAPYFVRVHHLNLAKTGLLLGGISAAGGWLGATCGGLLADAWGRKRADGRLLVGAASALLPIPLALGMLAAPSLALAAALALPITVLTALWVAPATTTAQELVPPRLRGTASAVLLLHTTFLGLALGPYTVGRLSVTTGSLKAALALALPVNLAAGLLLVLAARALPRPAAS